MSEDKKEESIRKAVTDKQFQLFKKTALIHIQKLGLHNWRLEFAHEEIDSYASTDHDVENHCAIVKLNKTWDEDGYKLNDDNLKTCAKHEVHHILLAKLAAYAQYRFVNRIQLDSAEEEIIRILDKFL